MEASATAGIHSCDLFLQLIPPPGPHVGDQVPFDFKFGLGESLEASWNWQECGADTPG